ncbi:MULTISPECIES: hypothetical protein [unclassified Flavobacterium]|jgi:hypothetical protein|uniref:hypothetical protein n=1 Tax=unclassified Flavobacterium TaxID=196869 RepID=UPI0025B8F804|nr:MULTISPECIES: hypothetical protein [unclassified Flavobacterium]
MRKFILIFFILFKGTLFSQDFNSLEKKLNNLIEKRIFWSDSQNENSYDSLAKYNKEFEKLILNFTSKNPKTLTHNFNKIKVGLNVISSPDDLFRIYTWNTFGGGSMQFYRNVFQYNIDGKVYSKLNKKDEEDNGCSFYEINEVEVKNKHYYITNSVSVGSSAVYLYEAKIFSIENGKLNENAKLIKTKSGIKNTLGYEVDLSSLSNRDRKDGVESRDYIDLIYDKMNKTIKIPLINEDGKITKNKITYKFKGEYFEKI